MHPAAFTGRWVVGVGTYAVVAVLAADPTLKASWLALAAPAPAPTCCCPDSEVSPPHGGWRLAPRNRQQGLPISVRFSSEHAYISPRNYCSREHL